MKLRSGTGRSGERRSSSPSSASSSVVNSDDHQPESHDAKIKLAGNHEWVIEDFPPLNQQRPIPSWANQPICIRHTSEQIQEFKTMRMPEYWDKKLMETREKQRLVEAEKETKNKACPHQNLENKDEIKVLIKQEDGIEVIVIID